MNTPYVADGAAFARTARVLTGALMGALLVILVVVTLVLAGVDGAFEFDPLPLAVQVAAGVAIHFLLDQIGYRTTPLSPSTEPERAATQAREQWRTSTILRFALSESIAIFSVAGAFVLDGGFYVLLGGVAVSLVLMVLHVWPSARVIDKIAQPLEANGARTGLRESFGHVQHGPIQRL